MTKQMFTINNSNPCSDIIYYKLSRLFQDKADVYNK